MFTWDELRKRASGCEHLTEDERLAAASAMVELKSIFGDQIFQGRHPVVGLFVDHAAGPMKWAIWMAEFLAKMRPHPDFQRLIIDLLNPSRYGERMTILNIADILSQSGFNFVFDKEVEIKGRPKKPDLFVELDQHQPGFFIEVSTLLPSEKEREANEVFYSVTELFRHSFYQLDFSGKIERILPPKHLEEILTKLKAMATKAVNESGFEVLKIEGVINLAAATKAHADKLEQWAKALGMKAGEFAGPSYDVPETDRIKFKLIKEQEQLPPKETNVVVIYSHLFSNNPCGPETFVSLAQAMEDAVYRHSHIGYLVFVFSWWGDTAEESYRFRDHYCINRKKFLCDCDTYMLIKNRFADKPMAESVERKFLEAFLRHARQRHLVGLSLKN